MDGKKLKDPFLPDKIMLLMVASVILIYLIFFTLFNVVFMTEEKITNNCIEVCKPNKLSSVDINKFTFTAICLCDKDLYLNFSNIYINKSVIS